MLGVGFDLVPRDGRPLKLEPTRRSSAEARAKAQSRDLSSPEGRNETRRSGRRNNSVFSAFAALFDQLDTNGDDEVNLQEFQAAQVATGQRKVDLFDELDSNLDGRVRRSQWRCVAWVTSTLW
eukprot:s1803_g21.t1